MSGMKNKVTRIASYSIIEDAGHVLLCRLSEEVQRFNGWWTLPGGGLEFGEHPEEGMVREVEEETGLLVRPAGLIGIDSLSRESDADEFHSIRIIYRAVVVGGELRFEEAGTTDMCHWHRVEEIDSLDAVSLVTSALGMANKQ